MLVLSTTIPVHSCWVHQNSQSGRDRQINEDSKPCVVHSRPSLLATSWHQLFMNMKATYLELTEKLWLESDWVFRSDCDQNKPELINWSTRESFNNHCWNRRRNNPELILEAGNNGLPRLALSRAHTASLTAPMQVIILLRNYKVYEEIPLQAFVSYFCGQASVALESISLGSNFAWRRSWTAVNKGGIPVLPI